MTPSTLPLLVSRDEAARALRCTPTDVDRLVAEGRLACVQLFADDVMAQRFRPEDLLALVEQAAGERPLGGVR